MLRENLAFWGLFLVFLFRCVFHLCSSVALECTAPKLPGWRRRGRWCPVSHRLAFRSRFVTASSPEGVWRAAFGQEQKWFALAAQTGSARGPGCSGRFAERRTRFRAAGLLQRSSVGLSFPLLAGSGRSASR